MQTAFVSYLSMERGPVSRGIYRNTAYAELSAGSDYTYRYLASVGDEYFFEHL